MYNIKDDQIISMVQSGPLTAALSATNWSPYRSGIFSCDYGSVVNHVVLLVGYTAEYWIVKNQWGTSWGE